MTESMDRSMDRRLIAPLGAGVRSAAVVLATVAAASCVVGCAGRRASRASERPETNATHQATAPEQPQGHGWPDTAAASDADIDSAAGERTLPSSSLATMTDVPRAKRQPDGPADDAALWSDGQTMYEREDGRWVPIAADPALSLFGEIDGVGGSPFQSAAVESIARVSFASEGADTDPDVDATGEWIVYASTQHNRAADLYRKSVAGMTITQLTSDPHDDVMPCFSPDNSQVAFCSNRNGNWDIFVMSAEGGAAVQITSDEAHELHPSWSPDGRHLVYCRLGEQSGRWELWVTQAADFHTPRFIGYGLFPEWCPDPALNLIVFQKARERGSRLFGIWTIEYVNGEGVRPTGIASAANAAAINPAWSPDGRMITFSTIVDPEEAKDKPVWADVWVVNLDGNNKVNLTNGQYANLQPNWSPDGRIFFVSNRAGVENVWAILPERAIETARGSRSTTTSPAGETAAAAGGHADLHAAPQHAPAPADDHAMPAVAEVPTDAPATPDHH